MIRDHSDGSVREKAPADEAVPDDPLLVELRAALLAGKVSPDRVSPEWAFQRAWNEGIDFSVRQLERRFQVIRSPEQGEG